MVSHDVPTLVVYDGSSRHCVPLLLLGLPALILEEAAAAGTAPIGVIPVKPPRNAAKPTILATITGGTIIVIQLALSVRAPSPVSPCLLAVLVKIEQQPNIRGIAELPVTRFSKWEQAP